MMLSAESIMHLLPKGAPVPLDTLEIERREVR